MGTSSFNSLPDAEAEGRERGTSGCVEPVAGFLCLYLSAYRCRKPPPMQSTSRWGSREKEKGSVLETQRPTAALRWTKEATRPSKTSAEVRARGRKSPQIVLLLNFYYAAVLVPRAVHNPKLI